LSAAARPELESLRLFRDALLREVTGARAKRKRRGAASGRR
jgi:hypothetical protein